MTPSSAVQLDPPALGQSSSWVPQVLEGCSGSAQAARSKRKVPPLAVSRTDEEILKAVRSGAPRGAADLYRMLRPAIERTLHRVLRGTSPDFEDLMQITFERVLRTLADGSFEGRSRLTTWASSIACNVGVDYLRRHSFERRLFAVLEASSLDTYTHTTLPERQLEARSQVRLVGEVLQHMKSQRVDVLVRHDVWGHSVNQVASDLGLNVHTTRSTLVRARQEFARRCAAKAR